MVMAQEKGKDDPGQERLSGQASEDFYSDALPEKNRASLFSLTTPSNPYTGSSYTHADTFDNCDIVYGIDVSKYQGNIDWTSVKEDGIDFTFVRAGYRGYGTAGTLTKDTYFEKNMQGAIAAGIKTGAYIFSQATNETEAEEEAEYIVNLVSGYQVTMPIVFDFEYASVNGGAGGRLYNARLSKAEATAVCAAFCAKVESLGYTPLIYMNKTMLENDVYADELSAQYKIWLANYTTQSTYFGDYDFWQYSSSGIISGISGKVDCNFWYVPKNGDTPNQGDDASEDDGSGEEPTVTEEIVTGLKKSASTTSSITLSWEPVEDADGYEIYRSVALDGTYSKVKTITDGSTTWKHTKLSAAKEYYYTVCAYQTIGSDTYYSEESEVLTAYTKAAFTRKAVTKASIKMKSTTQAEAEDVITVPKSTTLSVYCYTKDADGATWYRIKYTKNGKSYNGYIKGSNLTILRYGKTTASLNMRKNAGVSYGVVKKLPKAVGVTILSSKTASNGVTWYRVKCRIGKISFTGYVSSSYITFI